MRNVGHPFRGAAPAAILMVLVVTTAPAFAQVNGHVSVIADVLPDIDAADGAQPVGEMRVRLFAERSNEFGSHLRITLSGYVDGLFRLKAEATDGLAEAMDPGAGSLWLPPSGGRGTATDLIVRPADLFVDIVTSRFDLRAGAARLVWGRLDEFQPTDVVNPIDLSRFLMEGRSEARLSVGLVRGRVFLPRSTTIEAVVVPHFRRGRFDQLEEESSPFNLTVANGTPEGVPYVNGTPEGVPYEGLGGGALQRVRDEPDAGTESLQGGVRVTSTTARVDWSVSAYRGIRAFPISTLVADNPAQAGLHIRESFPRFTMIGGDFETVRGPWGVRGEIAAFVEDVLQSTRTVQGVPGHSITAGIGVDRRAGDYRVAANALWSWSGVDEDDPANPAEAGRHESPGRAFVGDDEVERTDLSFVLAADRSFARETRTVRVFAVYDPADSTAFARVIGALSLRDDVWLEGSGGVFTGSSFDVIGRLTRRDFLYARLKVFF